MNEPEFFEDAEEMGFIEKRCAVKKIQVVINEQPQALKEIFEIFDKKFSNMKLDIDKKVSGMNCLLEVEEIMSIIFSFLEPKTYMKLCAVSHQFYEHCQNNLFSHILQIQPSQHQVYKQ